MLENIEQKQDIGGIILSKPIDYMASAHDNSRDEYCFVFFDASNSYCKIGSYVTFYNLKNSHINLNISVISNIPNDGEALSESYAVRMSTITSGIQTEMDIDVSAEEFSNEVIEHIYGEVENGYRAIIGTGYRIVKLNSSLQTNYNYYQQSKQYSVSYVDDYDKDGLYDYQEIMFENNGKWLIDNSDTNNVELLTFEQLKSFMGDELFYVEKGLDRCYSYTGKTCSAITKLNNTKILPIKSDPTLEDGDYDGIVDYEENKWELMPLNSNYIFFDDWRARIDKNDELE